MEFMESNITELIGRRLRELRAASGLSLDALAHKSGVSRSNISLIERGQSSPTAVVLDKLSSALGQRQHEAHRCTAFHAITQHVGQFGHAGQRLGAVEFADDHAHGRAPVRATR